MPNADGPSLSDILAAIAETVSEQRGQLSERDVETIFFNEGFFERLGFDSPGVDVRQERTLSDQSRPDVTTLSDSSSVRAVYEFKEPTEPLGDHVDQLQGYVDALDADAGVLTNGLSLWLFDGDVVSTHRTLSLALLSAADRDSEANIATLVDSLSKDEWDFTNQADIDTYLDEVERSPLNLDTEVTQNFFFDTFRFDRTGPFGQLVETGMDLLDALREDDAEFVDGAYSFWQRSYARVPNEDNIPTAWEPYVTVDGGVDEDRLREFMFVLESGFALLSRLFLTKAADDYEFFMSEPIRDRLETLGGRDGNINPETYAVLLTELFDDLRQELIESLFEDDIFLWWVDGF